MSKISLSPDVAGTGIFTIASPGTSTNRTLTLPDDTGTIVTNSGNQAGSFTTLNTSGQVVFNDAGADVDFRVEGDTDANLLFVDASADRVGIGTSSPSARLSVVDADPIIKLQGNELSGVRYNRIRFANQPDLNVQEIYGGYFGIGGLYLADYSSTGILFGVSATPDTFTERMRIDSSGNLLVGATTAGGGAARIYVAGDATNAGIRVLANTSNTSVYAGVFRHESTTDGAYIQFTTDGGAETGRIFDSGGTMQYASSSDARLKTNVQPLQNGLDSVLALKPCTFDMRRGQNTIIASAGLIAQEVHEIYPYVVGVGGEDENTNPWSVDYGKLTPLLVAAIQELKAELDTVKAELATLKG